MEEPDFPSSGLSTIIPNIRQQEYFHWGSFPAAWKLNPAYGPRDLKSSHLVAKGNKSKAQLQKHAWAWHPNPMPSGAPPMFSHPQPKQVPDAPRNSGVGSKSWKEQLGHLHPFIKSFMQPFHDAFEGRVMLRRLLDACGLDNKKLPFMKEHVNPDTKRNNLCYNHVLGICPYGKDCIFVHVPGAEVENAFANELCRAIAPGIGFIMQTTTLDEVKKEAKSNKRQGTGKSNGSPPYKQSKPGV